MNKGEIQRRKLIKTILAIPVLTATSFCSPRHIHAKSSTNRMDMRNYKLSLNAYSFNEPLRKGTMTLDDLLEFCSGVGFDAVDLTGYYFPGYPNVPSDEYIYHIKKKAFILGLAISGTGVRNDFTIADENKRNEDISLVKKWIVCASKLGAPVIRIFSGTQNPQGYSRDQVLEWMIQSIKECVDYGKQHGVVVAIQNHYDFIKTAAETQKILELVDSDWFGLILDIGSYRGADPYGEIAAMAPSAVSWQLKENMFVNGVEVKTDVERIIDIVRASGYKGYLPIETLGAGEPKTKVTLYLEKVKKALAVKST
jgi:sugar phosphate isomerase/epimerase